MTVGELINELQNCDWNDEVAVKAIGTEKEFGIIGVGEWYDYSGKEGGSSPAILIEL